MTLFGKEVFKEFSFPVKNNYITFLFENNKHTYHFY